MKEDKGEEKMRKKEDDFVKKKEDPEIDRIRLNYITWNASPTFSSGTSAMKCVVEGQSAGMVPEEAREVLDE